MNVTLHANLTSASWFLEEFLMESYWAKSSFNEVISFDELKKNLGIKTAKYCKLLAKYDDFREEEFFTASDVGIILTNDKLLLYENCRKYIFKLSVRTIKPSVEPLAGHERFLARYWNHTSYSEKELTFINESVDRLLSTPILQPKTHSIDSVVCISINYLMRIINHPSVAYNMNDLLNDLLNETLGVGDCLNNYFDNNALAIHLFHYLSHSPFPVFAKLQNEKIILIDDCKSHKEIPLFYLLFFMVRNFNSKPAQMNILYSNYFSLLKSYDKPNVSTVPKAVIRATFGPKRTEAMS